MKVIFETDECASNPCQNDATCIDLVADYNCSCAIGYLGINCEIDINECDSNPCEYDATCEDSTSNNNIDHGDYQCLCNETAYYGKNCNINNLATVTQDIYLEMYEDDPEMLIYLDQYYNNDDDIEMNNYGYTLLTLQNTPVLGQLICKKSATDTKLMKNSTMSLQYDLFSDLDCAEIISYQPNRNSHGL